MREERESSSREETVRSRIDSSAGKGAILVTGMALVGACGRGRERDWSDAGFPQADRGSGADGGM